MADIILRIIVPIILFFTGVGVLNGLSKGIIKGKHPGSFGLACGVMLIWIIVFTLLDEFLRPIILLAIPMMSLGISSMS